MKEIFFRMRTLFLLVMVFALWQCTQDDNATIQIDEANSGLNITSQRMHYEDYEDNRDLMHTILPFMENGSTERTNETDLTIVQGEVLYIELEAYHSYTFVVDKEENLPLQNITFSLKDDGDYEAYLVTYDITQEELDAINSGVALDLDDKTIIETIDLDSGGFINRNVTRSRCATTIVESCVLKTTCDYGGSTHCAGSNCTQVNGTTLVCTPIASISNCAGDSSSDGTTDDSSTNDTGGGGGTDSQTNDDDAMDETVPCDEIPDGQGIEAGNGECVVGTGLTGPFTIAMLTPEEILILEIKQLIDLTDEQEQFLLDNIEFAQAVLDALENNGDYDAEEKVIIDGTFNNNERLRSVYDTFKEGNNTITGYLQNFEPEFSVTHLCLKADDNFSVSYPDFLSAGAITLPPSHFLIDIIFNTDSNLASSSHNFPTIILAVEFIHEFIHAEIYRKLLSVAHLPAVNFTGLSDEEWRAFLTDLRNNFPGLYDYWIRFELNEENPSSSQHNMMAQHYISIVAQALSDFDNGAHSQEFYEALAWIGLMDTIAWNNLNEEEQADITAIIINAIQNEPFD